MMLSTWSGNITADTVWDDTSEPYMLDGELTIDPGVTLSIMPNVEVNSSGISPLFVEGTLYVEEALIGSNIDLIVFTTGVVDLESSTVDAPMVTVEGTLNANSSLIRSEYEIYVSVDAEINLLYSVVESSAIILDYGSSGSILNSDARGVEFIIDSDSNLLISHNNLAGASVYTYGDKSLVIDLGFNFWGSPITTQQLEDQITHQADDGEYPLVLFAPILTSWPSTDFLEINIETSTNGFDADLPTGPIVNEYGLVSWTYQVTNMGDSPLGDVTVVDDNDTSSFVSDDFYPSYVSGDDNFDMLLDPGEIWIYQATGVAHAGQCSNLGTATGTGTTGVEVSGSDPSHYFGNSTIIAPEIAVSGNRIEILDGDTTPSSLDGTDFGTLNVGGSRPATQAFYIENIGNGPLTLGGDPIVEVSGLHASDFTVIHQPNSTVAASGGTTSFLVQFLPSAGYTRDATISITNSSSTESPYTFAISGTGYQIWSDSYESDNTAEEASSIPIDGASQTHSFHVGTDIDWVTFSLSESSDITLETSGEDGGDTQMWLYGPDSTTTQIEYDDDDGNVNFSRIVRTGTNALAPGQYYVKISEYFGNTLDAYSISVTSGSAMDYGDAPYPYPTYSTDGGPSHGPGGPRLGANWDGDADGQPSVAADGDDKTSGADEDGITFGQMQVGQLDATVTVNVQHAPNGAKLDAWIDFNGDGSWDDPGETIANSLYVVEGDNTITFDLPSGATEGDLYARFRLSTNGGLSPFGVALDGEVEDHLTAITWFSQPATLNTNDGIEQPWDDDPQLTTDGQGNWVAVWSSTDSRDETIGTDNDIFFARSIDEGQTWSETQVLNSNADSDSGFDYSPQLTTDNQGNWVAVWSSNNSLGGSIGTDEDIFFARSTNAGQTWTVPQPLNTNADSDSGSDFSPKLTTDGQGNWVAVWTSRDSLGGTIGTDLDILFARSTNGGQTWSAPQALNTNASTDLDPDSDLAPQLTTDSQGIWVAVWGHDPQLGADEDIFFARSINAGQTWSAPQPLNTNADSDSGSDFSPQLTTDGQGNWVAVWSSLDSLGGSIGTDDDILFARSTNGGLTWSAPQALNTNADTDSDYDYAVQLTTDFCGNWVAVWELYHHFGPDSDILFARSTDAGQTWSEIRPVNTDANTDSSYDAFPQLTSDGLGNWVAVWTSSGYVDGTTIWDYTISFARAFEPKNTVTLDQVDVGISEPGGHGTVRFERSGDVSASLVVDFVTSGSAIRGGDYRIPVVPGNSVTIPAGETFVDVIVEVIDDAVVEGTEQMVLSVVEGSGYDLGTQSSVAIDILDDDAVTGETQVVFGAQSSLMVPAGGSLGAMVRYETSDQDATLTTLGLRMHFDSSFLTYSQLDDLFSANLVASPSAPMVDSQNYDNDPNTDYYVLVAWSDIMGNWPGVTLPVDLFTAQFTVAEGLDVGASTFIQFSASDTAFGYAFESSPIEVMVASSCNLDVDLDGEARPATDGILILRYLFGFRDDTLIQDVVNPAGGRTSAVEIVDYLDSQRTTMLDVDGDGEARAATDGILILRYLFGFRDDTLIQDVVNPAGTRTTEPEIVAFLDECMPPIIALMPDALPDDAPLPMASSAVVPSTQLAFADPVSQTIQPNSSVSVVVKYDTLPSDDTLTTFGLRLHYNSTLLTSTGVTDLFTFGQISAPSSPTADTQDFDNDSTTDTYIMVAWIDIMGNWPGSSNPLPLSLFTANFTAQPGFTDGTTSINFSPSDTAFGWVFDSTSAQITVQGSTPPVANPGGPYVGSEGIAITFDGSASTDDVGIVAYEWDFNYQPGFFNADATGVAPSMAFVDDFATRTIALRVEDTDGAMNVQTSELTVINVLPTVNAGANQSVDVGQTVSLLSAGFSDPGSADTHTATVSWGDGTATSGVVVEQDGSGTVSASHQYTGAGTYSVVVTVTDDGGSSSDSFGVTVTAVGSQVQQVAPNPISQTLTFDQVPGGEAVSFDVVYSTQPANPHLTGLGFRMHFDSSELTFNNLSNLLTTGFVAQQVQADTANYDSDSATDKFLLVSWSDTTTPQWPGVDTTRLYTANFTATSVATGSSTVRFSTASTASGWDFASTPATVNFNHPPVANAGGPYVVDAGSIVALDASASADLDQAANTLLYLWDLDADGIFGETGVNALRGVEAGIAPVFTAAGLSGPSTHNVTVRVTDAEGASALHSSTVTVQGATSGPFQIVEGTVSQLAAPAGSSFQTTIQYSASDNDQTLSGLGMRMHYNSSVMTLDGLTDILPTGFVQDGVPEADADNLDGDSSTDTFVLISWASTSTNWPNTALPIDLFTANFTLQPGMAVGATSTIRMSRVSTAPTHDFQSQPITVTIAPPVNLDVDGNCEGDALTDGILILRYLFEFTGEPLVENALAPNATRTDPTEVENFLDVGLDSMLDVDGNGEADALTDGIIILRYLFEFTGSGLVENALGPNATRTDPNEIESYLDTWMPACASQAPDAFHQANLTDAALGEHPTTAILSDEIYTVLAYEAATTPSSDSSPSDPTRMELFATFDEWD